MAIHRITIGAAIYEVDSARAIKALKKCKTEKGAETAMKKIEKRVQREISKEKANSPKREETS